MFINVQLQLFRQANFHWIKGTIHLKNQRYIFSLSPVVLFIHLLFWCELPSFEDNSRRDDDGMMELDCTQQRRKISTAMCICRNHDPVTNDNPQSLLARNGRHVGFFAEKSKFTLSSVLDYYFEVLVFPLSAT